MKIKSGGKRKLLIILGIVAVVLAVSAAGGFIWHEQPEFCNAICHSPMDTYVEGYYSGDENLMITLHTDSAECLDCHEPTLSEQLAEAQAWITKDYSDPIRAGFKYDSSFCLNEGCHDMTREELTAATEDMERNVHSTRHGDLECSTCHSMHGTPMLHCAQCHEDSVELADELGWSY